eukprot:3184791-Rhodomonas_salina.6
MDTKSTAELLLPLAAEHMTMLAKSRFLYTWIRLVLPSHGAHHQRHPHSSGVACPTTQHDKKASPARPTKPLASPQLNSAHNHARLWEIFRCPLAIAGLRAA